MKIGGKEVKMYFHSENTIEYKGLMRTVGFKQNLDFSKSRNLV